LEAPARAVSTKPANDFTQARRRALRCQDASFRWNESGDGPAGWPRHPHRSIPLLPSGPGGVFDL